MAICEHKGVTPVDYLAELGTLGLGSRLRRLSEMFFEETADVYRFYNFDLEPRYFGLLSYLHHYGPVGVTEAAKALHLTHPAISQMSRELLASEWISNESDPNDERRRLLSLTDKGRSLIEELQPIWQRIEQSVNDILGAQTEEFLSSIQKIETNLRDTKFSKRVIRTQEEIPELSFCTWDPKFSKDFHDLNEEWVRRFFDYEESDAEILRDPQGSIRDKGGEVFFAHSQGEALGTCALIATGEREFELVKMCVSRRCQGQGIGAKLLEYALSWAEASGATRITLETNSQLNGALKLYQRFGFRRSTPDHESAYDRADVFMEKRL